VSARPPSATNPSVRLKRSPPQDSDAEDCLGFRLTPRPGSSVAVVTANQPPIRGYCSVPFAAPRAALRPPCRYFAHRHRTSGRCPLQNRTAELPRLRFSGPIPPMNTSTSVMRHELGPEYGVSGELMVHRGCGAAPPTRARVASSVPVSSPVPRRLAWNGQRKATRCLPDTSLSYQERLANCFLVEPHDSHYTCDVQSASCPLICIPISLSNVEQ
jgi:hypothetical protein